MTDFTVLKAQGNTGASDASPTWSDLLLGTAGYELRANIASNGAAGNIASASWPTVLRPASGATLMSQLWLYTADATGSQITTYDGTGAHYNQYRINWDNTGTFASACVISCWADSTLPAASPGTQVSPGTGANVVNGTSGESSSTSLVKCTIYGVGVTAAGTADNPASNMGSNPTVTSGGSGNTTTTAATWSAWKDLQAATNFFTLGAIPKATTAGTLNLLLAMYIAASMIGGVLIPVVGISYTWI